MKAEFRCLKCNYFYKDKPGPTICPVCGHEYVKWLNYEEMKKVWGNNLSTIEEYYRKHPQE